MKDLSRTGKGMRAVQQTASPKVKAKPGGMTSPVAFDCRIAAYIPAFRKIRFDGRSFTGVCDRQADP